MTDCACHFVSLHKEHPVYKQIFLAATKNAAYTIYKNSNLLNMNSLAQCPCTALKARWMHGGQEWGMDYEIGRARGEVFLADQTVMIFVSANDQDFFPPKWDSWTYDPDGIIYNYRLCQGMNFSGPFHQPKAMKYLSCSAYQPSLKW